MADELLVTVTGRPAPQGSKELGEHGQMLESSPYLAAWRQAVKRAVYKRYKALRVRPEDLPYLRGPVAVGLVFLLPRSRRTFGADGQRGSGPVGWRIDGPPDLDKLTRSTWDALTAARAWEDDGRVVSAEISKHGTDDDGGVIIRIRTVEEWE